MSENVKYKGVSCTIGTCENLYNITIGDYIAALKAGYLEYISGNLQPEEYLNPKYGFRFRFPFPGECNTFNNRYDPFKGYTLQIPADSIKNDASYHKTYFPLLALNNPKIGFQIEIDCPLSPVSTAIDLNGVRERFFFAKIMQQRIKVIEYDKSFKIMLETLFKCPFCDASLVFDDDDIQNLRTYVNAESENMTEDDLTVLNRIIAGYNGIIVPKTTEPVYLPELVSELVQLE